MSARRNEPQITFEGDEFTVHPYGEMAVVNFRLIAHNTENGNRQRLTIATQELF